MFYVEGINAREMQRTHTEDVISWVDNRLVLSGGDWGDRWRKVFGADVIEGEDVFGDDKGSRRWLRIEG